MPTPRRAGACSICSWVARRSSTPPPSPRRSSISTPTTGTTRPTMPTRSAGACGPSSVSRSASASGARSCSPRSRTRRAKPDGLVVIGPEREPRVRASLRIDQLWGVGRVTCRKLAVQGIAKLADVKEYSARDLAPLVGRSMARRLDAMAHGQDDASVPPAPAAPRPAACGRRGRCNSYSPSKSRSVPVTADLEVG